MSNAIDDLELIFLLDIHKDQAVYLEEPSVYLPNKKPGRGRKPSLNKTDSVPVEVKAYQSELADSEWQEINVRDTVKGVLTLSVHVRQVWTWDGIEEKARKRTLVITVNKSENKIKYSLSNSDPATTTIERFAYMQAQRYWVERAFQDAKSELGMSDYQVRKWNGWYHHMSLVMLALSFIVRERFHKKAEIPLLKQQNLLIWEWG